ncbi:MAG: hypothetical protein C0596_06660 [Marinilabiliales bacterium]|nr:MAG: hypothetical protein C0596_06660 [Marinilabiliales bacterium]
MNKKKLVFIINTDINTINNENQIFIDAIVDCQDNLFDTKLNPEISKTCKLVIPCKLAKCKHDDNPTSNDQIQSHSNNFNKQDCIICANSDAFAFEICILNTDMKIVYNHIFHVLQSKINISLPLSELPPGSYLLKLKNKNTCITNNFVKIK